MTGLSANLCNAGAHQPAAEYPYLLHFHSFSLSNRKDTKISECFDDHGDALAAADACSGSAELLVAPAQVQRALGLPPWSFVESLDRMVRDDDRNGRDSNERSFLSAGSTARGRDP